MWRYTSENIGLKNHQKLAKKEHPGGLTRDVQYYWRMVRDSNPRTSCPVSGFQDRRIRPLCQPSLTLFRATFFQTDGFGHAQLCCSDLASQSRPSLLSRCCQPSLTLFRATFLSNRRFWSCATLVSLTSLRSQDRRYCPAAAKILKPSTILYILTCQMSIHFFRMA